jgi:aryl-alcohol dehydrogenase-like predicted oxidoreductase
VDIMLCHDIEFVRLDQIIEETLPALRKEQAKGKVRFVGISGYPMHIFKYVLARADLDVILSYNHYTLQNTMLEGLVPLCRAKGVGIMNAAPFSARLLTKAQLPPWHKATPEVRRVARQAAEYAASRGVDIAQLAVQFSIQYEAFATCIVGSADPQNVRKWAHWAESPPEAEMIREVRQILEPIRDWFYIEGLPENNDSVSE